MLQYGLQLGVRGACATVEAAIIGVRMTCATLGVAIRGTGDVC